MCSIVCIHKMTTTPMIITMTTINDDKMRLGWEDKKICWLTIIAYRPKIGRTSNRNQPTNKCTFETNRMLLVNALIAFVNTRKIIVHFSHLIGCSNTSRNIFPFGRTYTFSDNLIKSTMANIAFSSLVLAAHIFERMGEWERREIDWNNEWN